MESYFILFLCPHSNFLFGDQLSTPIGRNCDAPFKLQRERHRRLCQLFLHCLFVRQKQNGDGEVKRAMVLTCATQLR
jgi:hypothetical protein